MAADEDVIPAYGPILTLEPLIDAIRGGVEACGWQLSGMQKTTSHQFEGRWEGEGTRSAYLFFHRAHGPDHVSIDVFLDETIRGLSGNLALVVGLSPLGDISDVQEALAGLAAVAGGTLPGTYETPISLRFRLAGRGAVVSSAESQVRFKVLIPGGVIRKGDQAASGMARESTEAFGRMIETGLLEPFTVTDR